MTAKNTALKALDAFNRHDAAAFAALYASDAVAYDPMYPEPIRGQEAIRRDAEAFFRAFPDVRCHLLGDVLEGSDRLAFQLRMTGTNQGPIAMPQGEQPPTGRKVETELAIFCQLGQDGLIRSEHRYFDMVAILAQLGLLPMP
jgi:steroid delta-isomerase-like uncharacterized protein